MGHGLTTPPRAVVVTAAACGLRGRNEMRGGPHDAPAGIPATRFRRDSALRRARDLYAHPVCAELCRAGYRVGGRALRSRLDESGWCTPRPGPDPGDVALDPS